MVRYVRLNIPNLHISYERLSVVDGSGLISANLGFLTQHTDIAQHADVKGLTCPYSLPRSCYPFPQKGGSTHILSSSCKFQASAMMTCRSHLTAQPVSFAKSHLDLSHATFPNSSVTLPPCHQQNPCMPRIHTTGPLHASADTKLRFTIHITAFGADTRYKRREEKKRQNRKWHHAYPWPGNGD